MGIIIPASVFEPEYASAVILSFHGVNIKSIPRIEKPHCGNFDDRIYPALI